MNSTCSGCARPVATGTTSSFGIDHRRRRRLRPRLSRKQQYPGRSRDSERPSRRSHRNLPCCSDDPPAVPLRTARRSGSMQHCGAMLERRTKIVATLGPATDADGVLDQLIAERARLRPSELFARLARRPAPPRRRRAGRERARRAPDRDAVRPPGPEAAALDGDTEPRAVAVGDEITFVTPGHDPGPDEVVVDFDKFTALVTERSEIVIGDGVPRFAVERIDGAKVVARAVSPGPIAPRKGINVTYARPELPAITEKDVADLGLAAELGRGLHRALVRALRRRHRAAADALARARLRGQADRQGREDRGLRGAGRDHRGLRRADGRARRLRRRGRRRARAADAEGHDPPRDAAGQVRDHRDPDAGVDDPGARADPRRGHRRRQRRHRRHERGDALGRDERRRLPAGGRARDGRDRRRPPRSRRSSTAAPARSRRTRSARRSCARRSSWPSSSTRRR